MGCAPSSPQDVDTLPIKAQCRTAFAKCSTMEPGNANGVMSEKQSGQQQEAEGHDVVLCYPLGGTVFGLELQARYEKVDSVSLWTQDHFLSLPGSPLQPTKSSSVSNGGSNAAPGPEIKPAPEPTEAAASPPTQVLSREVRLCRRGVVVLVTAGCTWDDGVLSCLRLTAKFLRPLVLVHCVQSCPLPALEEWPQDVRPLIAASGPPVKYLTQHSSEALRHVEQRMLAAAATASAYAATAAAPAPTVAVSVAPLKPAPAPPLPPPVAGAGGHCSCIQQALQGIPPQQQQQSAQQQRSPQQPQRTSAPAHQPSAGQQQQPQPQQPPGQHHHQDQLEQGGGDSGAPGLPLSLEALRTSGTILCRRAAQLLGPWAGGSSGGGDSPARGGPGGVLLSRCESPVTTTLVEALTATQRPCSSSSPRTTGAGAGHARLQPRSAPASSPDCSSVTTTSQKSSRNPSPKPGRNRQPRQQPQQAQRSAGVPPEQAGGVRCLLRYRDACWATPVAFVCAQLEEDLGQLNVSLQPAPAARQPQPRPRQPEPVPVTVACAAARLSLQSPEGWGRGRRPSPQRPDAGGKAGEASPAGAVAVTAAAPPPGRGPRAGAPRRSSSGSSGQCSASGCRPEVTSSESTSRDSGGGGGASPDPVIGDDELVAFSSPSADDTGTSAPIAAAGAEARSRTAGPAAAGCSGGGQQRSAPLRPEQVARPWATQDVEAGATCIYFVSPGLSAPLGCLEEIASGLARGRRVLVVVDGECCQQLPDYVPQGVAQPAWKAIKKLWQERLLYVQDYHASFYGLLKQGILASTTAAAVPKSPQ